MFFKKAYPLRCGFPWHCFAEEADFASIRIDFNNAKASRGKLALKFNAAVNHLLDNGFLSGEIARNS